MNHLKITNINQHTLFPGFEARLIHTEHSTIAFVDIAEGSDLPEHSHHNEQTLNLLEGKMELIVDGEKMLIEGGESVVLPPNAVHGGKAITACKVQDIFVPRREDFIENGWV